MDKRKKCMLCRKAISIWMRADAIYCSDACRWAGNRRKRSSMPEVLEGFQGRLVRYAPAEAIGYRVGLFLAGREWWYPPRDRESARWGGRNRLQPYFSLKPFEPPIVPMAGRYGARFRDRQGQPLREPLELSGGFELVPLLSIAVEDGEEG